MVLSTFEPKSPAQIPTPDSVFEAAATTQTDILFCVPATVEVSIFTGALTLIRTIDSHQYPPKAWSRNPACVKWLATRMGIVSSSA